MNGLKLDMLMYTDHLENWLDLVIVCWFSSFWQHFDLQFPGIFLGTQGENGLKFGMLMFSDHLQLRLDFGHGLLIFLIWTTFWLNETGQIWAVIFFRTHGRNGQKFYMLMYPDHIWNSGYAGVMVCWFSLFWCHFDLEKQVKCAVSRHIHDKVWEEWAEIHHVHLYLVISPEIKKANSSTWKLSSYRVCVCVWGGGGGGGEYPGADCSVVKLF